MHRKVIHVNFYVYILPYLRDHSVLRSRNYATMATWGNNLSSEILSHDLKSGVFLDILSLQSMFLDVLSRIIWQKVKYGLKDFGKRKGSPNGN